MKDAEPNIPLPENPLISVIVPIYNEEDTLHRLLERLRSAPFRKEIITVDDFSSDDSAEILKKEKDIVFLQHGENKGKGAAIRTGIRHAKGDIVIVQDADLEYDPFEIPKVIAPIAEGRSDIVFGSRFRHGLPGDMALPNKIANVLLVWTVRVLFRYKLTDEATCYKAVRTDLLRSMNLQCNHFEFCPEVTAKALKRGIKIEEVEIESYRPRSKIEGKKIKWMDGLEALATLVRYRFRD